MAYSYKGPSPKLVLETTNLLGAFHFVKFFRNFGGNKIKWKALVQVEICQKKWSTSRGGPL